MKSGMNIRRKNKSLFEDERKRAKRPICGAVRSGAVAISRSIPASICGFAPLLHPPHPLFFFWGEKEEDTRTGGVLVLWAEDHMGRVALPSARPSYELDWAA